MTLAAAMSTPRLAATNNRWSPAFPASTSAGDLNVARPDRGWCLHQRGGLPVRAVAE
jgi:hypothetical protein